MPDALLVLPQKEADAYTNMTDDLLMLENHPDLRALRFRHYRWVNPAFTFGFGQKQVEVSKFLSDKDCDLCRRPTGGGLVDHYNDWTYSLVLPTSNPLFRVYPNRLYYLLHKTLTYALREMGQTAELAHFDQTEKESEVSDQTTEQVNLSICFKESQKFDVVNPKSRKKIAGAALKRNRFGLLAQGSIDRGAVKKELDWNQFQGTFTLGLGSEFNAVTKMTEHPNYDHRIALETRKYFASEQWNNRR